MRISVATGLTIINQNEWSSCRYTKGEGFCLDDNTQGISLEYEAVYVDDVDAFVSQGGKVSKEMEITRISHPDLTYILDVDSIRDEDIPGIDSVSLSPSTAETGRYLSSHPNIVAEVCKEIDDTFKMVGLSVVVEAFRESSDQ